MSSGVRPAASLLIHRQASFNKQYVQPRSSSFSTTVANRFFSDNSLGRQKRLIETTRRRQAKAREKAQEQEYRLEQLQHEYEESMRLKALKEERELSRMECKLQNAAATYIQYSWRKYRYLRRIQAKRGCAVRVITAFMRLQRERRKRARLRAVIQIQRQWRKHRQRRKHQCCLAVLTKFIGALARTRWFRKAKSAMRLQRWVRSILARRKLNATSVLQRAWRSRLSKQKIAYCSKAYRHLKELEKLNHNAKVLQRALAKRAAYCRLVRSSELARYPHVMTQKWSSNPVISADALQETRQRLNEANRLSKRLTNQEASLTDDVESLQSRLCESKAKLSDKSEKLERFQALEAYRRSKDDSVCQQKLQELETQMRRDIRIELEKEFEAARRAQIRGRGKDQQQQQNCPSIPFLDGPTIISTAKSYNKSVSAMMNKGLRSQGGKTELRGLPAEDSQSREEEGRSRQEHPGRWPTDKTVNSAIKLRLYPDRYQRAKLDQMFASNRAIYNKLVASSKDNRRSRLVLRGRENEAKKMTLRELSTQYRPIAQVRTMCTFFRNNKKALARHLQVQDEVRDSAFRNWMKVVKSFLALLFALKRKEQETTFPDLKFKSKFASSNSIEIRARSISVVH